MAKKKTERIPTEAKQARPAYHLATRADRAEFFFLIYEALGPKRSIRRLYELVRKTGVAEKTLMRYSKDFFWQRRLLERAGEREADLQLDAVAVVKEMDARHAELFQDIGALARAGVSFFQAKVGEQLKAGLDPTLNMDIGDLVRLAESAQRGERIARGQATSKTEVIVEVVAPLVKEIMAVFLAVNVITNDPPEMVIKRQAEFIKRGDAILATYYEPAKALNGGAKNGKDLSKMRT